MGGPYGLLSQIEWTLIPFGVVDLKRQWYLPRVIENENFEFIIIDDFKVDGVYVVVDQKCKISTAIPMPNCSHLA